MEQDVKISDKISDKIRKLLAIANDNGGAASNERETALRQAYAMLAKYNLSMESINEEKNPRTGDAAEGHSMPWARTIAIHVANLFFCIHVTVPMRKVNRCGHMFVGKLSNAVTAKELSIFLINSVFKEGDKYRRQQRKAGDPNANQYMTNFCKGASIAIMHRCRILKAAQERENKAEYPTSTGTSITLASLYEIESKENFKFAASAFGAEEVKNKPIHYKNNESFNKGQSFGNSLPLSKSVDNKTANQDKIGV